MSDVHTANDANSTSTVEQVDQRKLQQAAEMLGTSSPRDTVNEALREVVRLRMVAQYLELMKEMSDDRPLSARTDAWR